MTQATPLRPSASSPLNSLVPLLFVALWSTGFIGAKYGLPYVEPFTFLSLRMGFVVALHVLIVWLWRVRWPTATEAARSPGRSCRPPERRGRLNVATRWPHRADTAFGDAAPVNEHGSVI